MKILVTGGCGFIGSNLVKHLLEMEHTVHIVDKSNDTKNIEGLNVKLIKHDIRDKCLKLYPYDVIYHLAALARIQPSFENAVEYYTTNSLGTINVLEYAKKINAKVIYAGSSSSGYKIHANPYTYTKWLGEQHCILYSKIYQIRTTIARFFNVFGENQITEGDYATLIGIFERQKRANEPLTIIGDGNQYRDFTYVGDVISGLYLMAFKDFYGEIFNLGSGKSYSINEVAELFKSKVKYLPKRQGEVSFTMADINKTKNIFKWEPKTNLEDYIAKVIYI